MSLTKLQNYKKKERKSTSFFFFTNYLDKHYIFFFYFDTHDIFFTKKIVYVESKMSRVFVFARTNLFMSVKVTFKQNKKKKKKITAQKKRTQRQVEHAPTKCCIPSLLCVVFIFTSARMSASPHDTNAY